MPAEPAGTDVDAEEYEPAPWHFKLLIVAFVLYLLFRLVQLIDWAFRHFF